MLENYSDEVQFAAGAGSGYGVYKGAKKLVKKPFSKFFLSQLCNTTKEQNDVFWSAANKAYENSDLKETLYKEIKPKQKKLKTFFGEVKLPKIVNRKKAEIINVNPKNISDITKDVMNKLGFDRNPVFDNKLFKLIFGDKKAEVTKHLKKIAIGKNACFITRTGQVLVNKDKMAFSTFHELGHAMNATGKGLGKFLAKSRATALFAPLILATGLLKNKPQKSTEQNQTKKNFFDFVKENCGILTTLCCVPTILEEGLASIKGAKLAKPYLDKDMVKKLNIMNAKAWSSYVCGAILAGLFVKAGVMVRDKIVHDDTFRIIEKGNTQNSTSPSEAHV